MSEVLFSVSAPVEAEGTAANPIAGSPIELLPGPWWVVHTKARNEKALAASLERLRIGYFLPLVNTRRRYGGHTVWLQLPLFPSYLFLAGEEEDRYATLMTHRAAAVIRVTDQERLKKELIQIYRLTVSSEATINLYPSLRRGHRCRVVRGSLAGLEGVILQRRDQCRMYVGIEALGQSAELEIDPSLLEALD